MKDALALTSSPLNRPHRCSRPARASSSTPALWPLIRIAGIEERIRRPLDDLLDRLVEVLVERPRREHFRQTRKRLEPHVVVVDQRPLQVRVAEHQHAGRVVLRRAGRQLVQIGPRQRATGGGAQVDDRAQAEGEVRRGQPVRVLDLALLEDHLGVEQIVARARPAARSRGGRRGCRARACRAASRGSRNPPPKRWLAL